MKFEGRDLVKAAIILAIGIPLSLFAARVVFWSLGF